MLGLAWWLYIAAGSPSRCELSPWRAAPRKGAGGSETPTSNTALFRGKLGDPSRGPPEITDRGVVEAEEGLLRESNPGPLAPKARIMPLDQAAGWLATTGCLLFERALRAVRTLRNMYDMSLSTYSVYAILSMPLSQDLGHHDVLPTFQPSRPGAPTRTTIPRLFRRAAFKTWGADAHDYSRATRGGCSGNRTQDLSHPKRESYH